MKTFTKLTAIAAPLPLVNVDTDVIIPKQFLKTIERTGLGKFAFYDLRYDENENEKPEFILNKTPYRQAKILIAGKNFGCGSSREHAPWALLDLGIQCVIAPSFADIFYNNCFKNGILPLRLPQDQVDQLTKEAQENPDSPFEIDLEKQTVIRGNKFSFNFEIDAFHKESLLKGLDDVAMSLQQENAIKTYEDKMKAEKPWLAGTAS